EALRRAAGRGAAERPRPPGLRESRPEAVRPLLLRAERRRVGGAAGGALPVEPEGLGVLPEAAPLLPARHGLVGGERQEEGDEAAPARHHDRALGKGREAPAVRVAGEEEAWRRVSRCPTASPSWSPAPPACFSPVTCSGGWRRIPRWSGCIWWCRPGRARSCVTSW